MYNSQLVAQQIKIYAKQKNISVNQLLSDCGLGKNTITKMANGTDILSQNLYKIADYLDCSVDYLLGRDTDTALTEKQKWLIDAYDNLDEEYQRLIDKRIEQYSKEQDEELVFEKIRRREEKQLKEILAKERKTDVNIPASK